MIRYGNDPARKSDPSVKLSNPLKKRILQGRCAMPRAEFGDLPRENPCAQCGRPISIPEWIEAGKRRTSYLWHCYACDYRFEAVAFESAQPDQEQIAA
jgi:hypothetical protein